MSEVRFKPGWDGYCEMQYRKGAESSDPWEAIAARAQNLVDLIEARMISRQIDAAHASWHMSTENPAPPKRSRTTDGEFIRVLMEELQRIINEITEMGK